MLIGMESYGSKLESHHHGWCHDVGAACLGFPAIQMWFCNHDDGRGAPHLHHFIMSNPLMCSSNEHATEKQLKTVSVFRDDRYKACNPRQSKGLSDDKVKYVMSLWCWPRWIRINDGQVKTIRLGRFWSIHKEEKLHFPSWWRANKLKDSWSCPPSDCLVIKIPSSYCDVKIIVLRVKA